MKPTATSLCCSKKRSRSIGGSSETGGQIKSPPKASMLSWIYTGEHLADLGVNQDSLGCGAWDIHSSLNISMG